MPSTKQCCSMQNGRHDSFCFHNPAAAWFKNAPTVAKPRRAKKAKIVREDDVEGKYVREQESKGALVLKVKVLGRPGYPDRLVLNGVAQALIQYEHEFGVLDEAEVAGVVEKLARIIAAAFRFAELKKTAHSPFQPKQKTIIPMLCKRGFTVDIVHG